MPVTRSQAKQISTGPEYELVEASFRPAITELSPARLRSKIVRARKLQDKYRDLARRQHRDTKDGTPPVARSTANQRTERKVRLFAETQERFEKRLAQLEAKGGSAGEGVSPGRATRRTGARQAAAERRKERRQAKRELE